MIEDNFLIPLYQKFPVKIVRGSGALVYDEKGNEYIDLAGGYGVAIVGHANPAVTDAIVEQAKKLIICHGSFYNDTREKYLELLSKHLPGDLSKIFFCNSGAEANQPLKLQEKSPANKTSLPSQEVFTVRLSGPCRPVWSQKVQKTIRTTCAIGKIFSLWKPRKGKGSDRRNNRCCHRRTYPRRGWIHVSPDGFLSGLRESRRRRGHCWSSTRFNLVSAGRAACGLAENWDVTPYHDCREGRSRRSAVWICCHYLCCFGGVEAWRPFRAPLVGIL